MKENIEFRRIQNRKIILEIRFDNKPIFLDKKGLILEELTKLVKFKDTFWNLNDSFIRITDSDEHNKERNSLTVEMSRIHFSSSNSRTLEEFFKSFNSFYEYVLKQLGKIEIKRIGCRIIGTYNVKSNNYETILESFKTNFPAQIFIEDFRPSDYLFRINYSNGSYTVGPTNKDDTFLKANFPYDERENKVGIGLDIDSFLLNKDKKDLNNLENIKDVFVASLSVEKSLLERMENF